MIADGGSAVVDHDLISLCRLDFHYLAICAWWLDHKQRVNSIRGPRSIARVPSYGISATSRSSRAFTPTLPFLEKMLRPSPPALREARNGEQSLDLFPISSIDSKYVSNREIVRRSYDDAQLCAGSQRFGKSAHKPLIVHPNS